MSQQIEIIAGPNGSGKSTFAEAYFKLRNGKGRFINADTIATGLAAGHEPQAAFHAGRVVLNAIEEAIAAEQNFAFESTLSGLTWQPILKNAIGHGYAITIYFVCLTNCSLNLRRIRQRVKEGGHSIPNKIVIRRHSRSFVNFWKIYSTLSQNWYVFDNSGSRPEEIMSKMKHDRLEYEERSKFEKKFLSGKLGL